MKIYIVQEIIKGIAECPKLFKSEDIADQVYVKLVNIIHKKNFKIEKTASKFMEKINTDTDIKYWIAETRDIKF